MIHEADICLNLNQRRQTVNLIAVHMRNHKTSKALLGRPGTRVYSHHTARTRSHSGMPSSTDRFSVPTSPSPPTLLQPQSHSSTSQVNHNRSISLTLTPTSSVHPHQHSHNALGSSTVTSGFFTRVRLVVALVEGQTGTFES